MNEYDDDGGDGWILSSNAYTQRDSVVMIHTPRVGRTGSTAYAMPPSSANVTASASKWARPKHRHRGSPRALKASSMSLPYRIRRIKHNRSKTEISKNRTSEVRRRCDDFQQHTTHRSRKTVGTGHGAGLRFSVTQQTTKKTTSRACGH